MNLELITFIMPFTAALLFILGTWFTNLITSLLYNWRAKKHPDDKDYYIKQLEKEKKFNLVYWAALFIILLAPMVINAGFSSNEQYPTALNLGNAEWLGFWGSYMGGVVGAIVTGVAFFFTYRQNKKQHEQTREQINTQHRLQHLPVLALDLKAETNSGFLWEHQGLDLSTVLSPNTIFNSGVATLVKYCVTNISSHPALFFSLDKNENEYLVNHILPLEKTVIYLSAPYSDNDYEGNFHLYFFDVEGNYYGQQVRFVYKTRSIEPLRLLQPAFPQLIPNPSYKTDPSTHQPSEVNL